MRTGFSSRDEALEKGRNKLEQLARVHIIPPVPVTRAVYTHPFLMTWASCANDKPNILCACWLLQL